MLRAEFLSKEEEEMAALLYITLRHLPRRRDTAVEKTAFTHSFVSGLNTSQERWGLVNKLAGNHANGSAIAGSPPGWGGWD